MHRPWRAHGDPGAHRSRRQFIYAGHQLRALKRRVRQGHAQGFPIIIGVDGDAVDCAAPIVSAATISSLIIAGPCHAGDGHPYSSPSAVDRRNREPHLEW